MQTNGLTELNTFVSGWSQMMVEIWQEKLIQLNVRDTGALFDSVVAMPIVSVAGVITIPHKFLEYGIYVDAGTGREFGGARNQNGQLVGKNGEKKTINREAKEWFRVKRFASVRKLAEATAEIFGEKVRNTVVSTLKI